MVGNCCSFYGPPNISGVLADGWGERGMSGVDGGADREECLNSAHGFIYSLSYPCLSLISFATTLHGNSRVSVASKFEETPAASAPARVTKPRDNRTCNKDKTQNNAGGGLLFLLCKHRGISLPL